jgi:Tfp pilus assembly protein PilO
MKNQGLSGPQRKPKTWLITGLLAAVAVAYVVMVFVPGQKSIGEMRADVQQRHQQIVQAHSIARPIALAQQRLDQTRQVGLQWRQTAPRLADLSTWLARLTEQSEAAGVKIQRLDPVPVTELNLIAQQNVALQFTGSFAAAFELLGRLESLPGTIWIRDLRLTGDPAAGQIRGDLTLTIFVDRADYSD